MSQDLIYSGVAILLFVQGVVALLLVRSIIKKVIAANIAGIGIFIGLVATALRPDDVPHDPVPQALVLTGIVVAVATTSLALSLASNIRQANDRAAK